MAPSVNQLEKKDFLKILCATENKKLVGIAPFRITQKNLGLLSYHLIEPITNGNTDYAGLLIPKQGDQLIRQFLKHLFNQKNWDIITIPDLPQTSPTLELLKQNSKNLPQFKIEKGIICPYVTIPNSEKKLLNSLNPKFRKNLTRRLNKLEKEQGKVEITHYYEFGSLQQAMKIFFSLHQKRWMFKGEKGGFGNQKSREFTMETIKFFAERDWLRLHFLTVNNKPVAVSLDLEYQGKMYGHLSGFDPEYSKYSVGNLLMLKILKQCVEKGLSEYDFMQGDEAYKFDWTNKFRQNMNIKFVNKKFSSLLINLSLQSYKLTRRSLQIIKNRIIGYPK